MPCPQIPLDITLPELQDPDLAAAANVHLLVRARRTTPLFRIRAPAIAAHLGPSYAPPIACLATPLPPPSDASGAAHAPFSTAATPLSTVSPSEPAASLSHTPFPRPPPQAAPALRDASLGANGTEGLSQHSRAILDRLGRARWKGVIQATLTKECSLTPSSANYALTARALLPRVPTRRPRAAPLGRPCPGAARASPFAWLPNMSRVCVRAQPPEGIRRSRS